MISNHAIMRETNAHQVITEIINNPEISRSEISENTGLNKSTVSIIVKKLIKESYVVEIGTGKSSTSGGRRPVLLRINKKSGISLSIDIQLNRISYMVNYLNGDIIEINSFEKNINSKNVIDEIVDVVNQFTNKANKTPFGIIGVSIAIHGIISNNRILFTPYYDLSEIDLANQLKEKLKIPIYLENEANLAAMAESSLDNFHKNIVNCSIHTGIGAGVIIDKKLYQGFEGHSGEIGHTTLYPGGLKCSCGNKGCFEQYCSQSSIINFYRIAKQNFSLNLNDLVFDYKNEDYVAIKIINEFSKNLSIGISNLIRTYGPEIIYLNSELVKRLPNILKDIQIRLSQTIYKDTPIKLSEITPYASLYGATVLNIEKFLGVDSLQLSFNHFEGNNMY